LNPKARIEALGAAGIDIALASHGIDVNALNRQGMQVTEIARTAVVFAVNAGVGVSNLSRSVRSLPDASPIGEMSAVPIFPSPPGQDRRARSTPK
jgi:hypothetical protein